MKEERPRSWTRIQLHNLGIRREDVRAEVAKDHGKMERSAAGEGVSLTLMPSGW